MAYCDWCDHDFPSHRALAHHLENSRVHNVCNDCNVSFTTWNNLVLHWFKSPRHNYCQECDEHFYSKDSLLEHYRDWHSLCVACDKTFNSVQALHRHCQEQHWYCGDCRCFFGDKTSLRDHLGSIHYAEQTLPCLGKKRLAERKVPCPGKKCRKRFASGAALVNHLESGACSSRITREQVNYAVAKYDTEHIVTIPERMIGYVESESQPPPVVTTLATERSWNGDRYECFLCHREFNKLDWLNQHLASPAHEAQMYRCPTGYFGCGREFKTLSGLCKHVESGRCGIRRFNAKMQDYLGDLSGKMKCLNL